jgi:hypothetical protein
MIHFTDITGLAGIAIVFAAIVIALPVIGRLPQFYRVGLAGIVMILLLIPFNGFPAAAYLRGVTGDLSITTVLLALLSLASVAIDRRLFEARQYGALQIAVICAALALYPMALGLGYFDPYRLGYGNPWFIGGLLGVTLFCLYRRYTLTTLSIVLATLAWATGWMESPNLWDYLLDPLVAVYAVVGMLRTRSSRK